MARNAPCEDGFLLLEALIAFAIIAMMSTLVYLTVAQVGQAAGRVVERRSALLLARSVLAATSIDSRARAISSSGTDGNLVWSIATETYRTDETGSTALHKITVTITDRTGGHQLARLATLGSGA